MSIQDYYENHLCYHQQLLQLLAITLAPQITQLGLDHLNQIASLRLILPYRHQIIIQVPHAYVQQLVLS